MTSRDEQRTTQTNQQVLDGADTALDAVADEPGRLVIPLGVQEVDGVLQRARGSSCCTRE